MTHIEKFIYKEMEYHYNESEATDMPILTFVKEIVTEEVERGLFRATLDFTGSDLNKAANILGISVESLKEKIDSYDIYKMAS